MLTKRGFRGVWSMGLVLCLVFSVMLLAAAPLMAQEKPLEEQLEEAKAGIEDQEWVIKQLEKNFFKVVGELNEELDFLRALSSKQLKEFEEETATLDREITSLKAETATLDREIASLKGETAKLEAANARLKRHRLLLGLGFIVAAYYACS